MSYSTPEVFPPVHQWEDVSRHGSPVYECRFCDCLKNSERANLPCPKASEVLTREAKEREHRERGEYERMRKERERWEYLRAKYEGRPAP